MPAPIKPVVCWPQSLRLRSFLYLEPNDPTGRRPGCFYDGCYWKWGTVMETWDPLSGLFQWESKSSKYATRLLKVILISSSGSRPVKGDHGLAALSRLMLFLAPRPYYSLSTPYSSLLVPVRLSHTLSPHVTLCDSWLCDARSTRNDCKTSRSRCPHYPCFSHSCSALLCCGLGRARSGLNPELPRMPPATHTSNAHSY